MEHETLASNNGNPSFSYASTLSARPNQHDAQENLMSDSYSVITPLVLARLRNLMQEINTMAILENPYQANVLLEQALYILKQYCNESNHQIALVIHNLGVIHYHWRNYNRAQVLFMQALEVVQTCQNHYETGLAAFNLSMVHLALDQYSHAAARLRQAISIFTHCETYMHCACFTNHSSFLREMVKNSEDNLRECTEKIYEQSINKQAHQQCLAQNPDAQIAHRYLFNHYYRCQDRDNAIHHAEEFTRLNPVKGRHILASLYHAVGQFEKANQQFLKALEINACVETYTLYGYFLYQQQRYCKAIDYLEQAIINGDTNRCLQPIFYNMLEESVFDDVLQDLLAAKGKLSIHPVVLAYYSLAQCYIKQGQIHDYENTLESFKKWLSNEHQGNIDLVDVIVWRLAAYWAGPIPFQDDNLITHYEMRLCQFFALNTPEYLELGQAYYHDRNDYLAALIYAKLVIAQMFSLPYQRIINRAYKLQADCMLALAQQQERLAQSHLCKEEKRPSVVIAHTSSEAHEGEQRYLDTTQALTHHSLSQSAGLFAAHFVTESTGVDSKPIFYKPS